MSRIGKLPIQINTGVTVVVQNDTVTVTGPKGSLKQLIRPEIKVEVVENNIVCSILKESKNSFAYWGLTRALLNNMVKGVTKGYSKKLQLVGVGYRAKQQGSDLVLNLGYSHPIEVKALEGINILVEDPTNIVISGSDKQSVGLLSAKIRKLRPPEPYKGKGIKYIDEIVRRKVGKTGKTGKTGKGSK